ncbi:MAG: tyrosine-type recombinase/integrase [Actinobacteria bacterium]|nr:tyrosine-type recombinase/integrase [Actinomycetota bacterium]
MPGRDFKTKYQGVFARHQQACSRTSNGKPKLCNCTPSYYGVAWDRAAGKHRKTRRFPRAAEARNAREDLLTSLREGKLPASTAGPQFDEVRDKFIEAARSGVALNKWGRRYRRRAWEDLESALRQVPEPIAKRRLGDVRRGDVQRLVDDLSASGMSGSRVRSVVNALRSLYRWAQDRELVSRDPAALVRLPAMDATPRERVASPAEFASLLSKLPVDDAVPYALAGYGTARHQEIRVLDWRHVDLKLGAVELAADEEGRKPGGSWRVVPLVKPALTLLKRAWIAQGRPREGKVCPPRYSKNSGMLALSHLQHRVHKQWVEFGLKPIGLHEARHTAATWLDHAGVSPKVASQLMGHKTPEYQPGAASITLQRYTHTLPGELERARDLLERFLAERVRQESSQG